MNHKDQRNNTTEFSDWICERYILGELDEAEMERIRRAAEDDESLRTRLKAIVQSNHEILRDYPPGWIARQIESRLAGDAAAVPGARRRRRQWSLGRVLVPVGLVAVIALAVVVLPNLIPIGDQTGPEVVRLKGPSPQLRLHRKTASGSEQLEDGERASEHDLVLLQYQTDDRRYAAILSVDGWGRITRHLPESGSDAVELELGRPHLMDHAYELDDAPSWEVFYLVTSASAFPIDVVVGAIEASLSKAQPDSVSGAYVEQPRAPSLGEDFRISSFTLIKDSRHEN